jgi:hypothetical protein
MQHSFLYYYKFWQDFNLPNPNKNKKIKKNKKNILVFKTMVEG